MDIASLRQRIRSLSPAHWTEIRFHRRTTKTIGIRKAEVVDFSDKLSEGVGIRVLVNGAWGFSSTTDLSLEGLTQSLKEAEKLAHELSSHKKKKVQISTKAHLAKGDFEIPGIRELQGMPLEEKFRCVQSAEKSLRDSSSKIQAASCSYNEILEEKLIFTSDGADASIVLIRPEIRMAAFGADGATRSMANESIGGTGAWNCLFTKHSLDEYISEAGRVAVDSLKAPFAKGGKATVILSPAMVGLLSHEAIGHTVEADLVSAGSVAADKIGKYVASPLVTMCDSGASEHKPFAGGIIPVDDEGVFAHKAVIIKDGKLNSFLHNRESAAEYNVEPTGNARAWEFRDEPLIRMRNTYIEPGKDNLEKMISEVEDGFLIDGPAGGQADSTGEFMFGATKVRKIRGGKVGELLQKLTVSGKAFEVLESVDAVSTDFQWDLGSGYCGKGQPAKVDAGGPYLRCQLLIGGAEA